MKTQTTFEKLKPGDSGRVVKYICEDDCAMRLQEMGLCEGTEFTVVKIAPMGDPVEVEFRRCRLCIRKSEMCQVAIEKLMGKDD